MTTGRIQELVEKLNLQPHPEGGFYSETYRAEENLDTRQGERSLATSIFFLLRSEDVSHFHRIKSDELWFWHEGSPLTVHVLGESGHQILKLGPADASGTSPQQVVKANSIFGSTVDQPDSFALVSCVVAPGFDFRDFELFTAGDLLPRYPDSAAIIHRLT
ncbi:cupin domain-containing protein [Algoriphagus sp. H41]|uniref:Cupin domain-containing protein n=1 Tax=Algoriphagus oliviformis TaxID=2811231 RepID=A0ABS3C025_9BACT|nr:cupin domain-containing protein [Algoriphagus oliviformis]MBN7809996.1 cupin domain-containing protein [Algoriphagus oliviformis]